MRRLFAFTARFPCVVRPNPFVASAGCRWSLEATLSSPTTAPCNLSLFLPLSPAIHTHSAVPTALRTWHVVATVATRCGALTHSSRHQSTKPQTPPQPKNVKSTIVATTPADAVCRTPVPVDDYRLPDAVALQLAEVALQLHNAETRSGREMGTNEFAESLRKVCPEIVDRERGHSFSALLTTLRNFSEHLTTANVTAMIHKHFSHYATTNAQALQHIVTRAQKPKMWSVRAVQRNVEHGMLSTKPFEENNSTMSTSHTKEVLCLVLYGSSGCGKSFILQHIHYILQHDQFTELPNQLKSGQAYIHVPLLQTIRGMETDEKLLCSYIENDVARCGAECRNERVMQFLMNSFERILQRDGGLQRLNPYDTKDWEHKKLRLLFTLDEMGQYPCLVRGIVSISRDFAKFGKKQGANVQKYFNGWNFVMAGTSGDVILKSGLNSVLATDPSLYHAVNLDEPLLPCKIDKEKDDLAFRRKLLEAHLGPGCRDLVDSLTNRSTCDPLVWDMLRNPRCVGDGLTSIFNRCDVVVDDTKWYDPLYHQRRGDWSGLNVSIATQYLQLNALRNYSRQIGLTTRYTQLQRQLLCALQAWEDQPIVKHYHEEHKNETDGTVTKWIRLDALTDVHESLNKVGLLVLKKFLCDGGDIYRLCAPPGLVGVALTALGVGQVKESRSDASERLVGEYFGLRLAYLLFAENPAGTKGEKLPTKQEQQVGQELSTEVQPKKVTLKQLLPTVFLDGRVQHLTSCAIAPPSPANAPDYVVVDAPIQLQGLAPRKSEELEDYELTLFNDDSSRYKVSQKESTEMKKEKKPAPREQKVAVCEFWGKMFKLSKKHRMVVVQNKRLASEADVFLIIRFEGRNTPLVVRVQVQNYAEGTNISFFNELRKIGGYSNQLLWKDKTKQEKKQGQKKQGPGVEKPTLESAEHTTWMRQAAKGEGFEDITTGWLFATTRRTPQPAPTYFWTKMSELDKLGQGHIFLPEFLASLVFEKP